MLILDVDRKNGGDASFAKMCAEIGADVFEGVPLVGTPGGRHYWYRRPDPPISRRIGVLPGIDLLGVGGYAIAPPSVRLDGSYVWAREYADDADEIKPADLPEFPQVVHEYLIAAQSGLVQPRKLVSVRCDGAEVGKIYEGWRNTRLTSLAGTLVAGGYGEDAIKAALHAVNEKSCVPMLQNHVIDGIVKSAVRNFDKRYVDAEFLRPWLRSDFGTTDSRKQFHALRLLVLYARNANQSGVAAPNETQVLAAIGLSQRHYIAARMLLETAGAIVVQPRGRALTTIIVLQWKSSVTSCAA